MPVALLKLVLLTCLHAANTLQHLFSSVTKAGDKLMVLARPSLCHHDYTGPSDPAGGSV